MSITPIQFLNTDEKSIRYFKNSKESAIKRNLSRLSYAKVSSNLLSTIGYRWFARPRLTLTTPKNKKLMVSNIKFLKDSVLQSQQLV